VRLGRTARLLPSECCPPLPYTFSPLSSLAAHLQTPCQRPRTTPDLPGLQSFQEVQHGLHCARPRPHAPSSGRLGAPHLPGVVGAPWRRSTGVQGIGVGVGVGGSVRVRVPTLASRLPGVAARRALEKEKRWITLGALGQKCASPLYVKCSAARRRRRASGTHCDTDAGGRHHRPLCYTGPGGRRTAGPHCDTNPGRCRI